MAELDIEILRMALIGYEAERQKVEERIAEIRNELGGKSQVAALPDGAEPAKRKMSASGKARIAAAQRKRWAEYHKEHEPTAPAKKAKRVFSPAAKKRIADATRKRWATYRALKAGVSKKAPATKAAPKRKLSPARKAALVANLAKARAARAAKKNAGDAVPF